MRRDSQGPVNASPASAHHPPAFWAVRLTVVGLLALGAWSVWVFYPIAWTSYCASRLAPLYYFENDPTTGAPVKVSLRRDVDGDPEHAPAGIDVLVRAAPDQPALLAPAFRHISGSVRAHAVSALGATHQDVPRPSVARTEPWLRPTADQLGVVISLLKDGDAGVREASLAYLQSRSGWEDPVFLAAPGMRAQEWADHLRGMIRDEPDRMRRVRLFERSRGIGARRGAAGARQDSFGAQPLNGRTVLRI